jgi:hypothetical protein
MIVWNSPEFIAFCERFGIPRELASQDLVIHLPIKGVMTVIQKYLPKAPRIEAAIVIED